MKLDDARLIELQPRLKARLRVGPVVSWRVDGPVHRVYERQVKAEFLQAEFQGSDHVLHFRSAELSEASTRVLVRKIEQLARDFAELATLDVGLPAAEKKNVALLAAFRPWVSSMFQEIKADDRYRRSSSLRLTLARVCASTRLTITAQFSAYRPSFDGSEPGTTTAPAGTRPYETSSRSRS